MASTNAAGARSLRYGSVRRWVEALTLITADGESVILRRGDRRTAPPWPGVVARFEREVAPVLERAASLVAARFPRTRKNSSGYALDAYLASKDVLDLVVGAEGTLGIVTEIEWTLDPAPACRAGLRLALGSLDDLAPIVASLSGVEPSAIELLDRSFLDLVATDRLAGAGLRFSGAEAVLLVEVERNDPVALRQALEQATAVARPVAMSVDTAFSPEAAGRLWAIRHAASPILAALPESRRSLQVIEDACVPVDRMGEYIRGVRRTASRHGVPLVLFGHAGDGHIHVNLLPDVSVSGWEEVVSQVLEEVTELVVSLDGTPSGEHGDGRLRASTLNRVYGPEIVDLFRLVKQSFDPMGIFNPGIILPAGEPPVSRLKVGSRAVPIPADLEQALREIERSGGYGRSRLEIAGS
jgi:FAD/FMN-containing dehydrogenase